MVKKLLLFIAISSLLAVAKPTQAQLVAGNSATMYYTSESSLSYQNSKDLYLKKKVLKEYLEKSSSPMLPYVDSFLEACSTYDLDCYLLPAISGVESTFGKFIAPGTNNAFGWGRGIIPFTSFHEAIMTVGKGLRENYIDKGATSVNAIGAIYCEGNTWSGKVTYFMNKFEESEKNKLFFSDSQVQL